MKYQDWLKRYASLDGKLVLLSENCKTVTEFVAICQYPVIELEAALLKLIKVASQCDSWEYFPESALE